MPTDQHGARDLRLAIPATSVWTTTIAGLMWGGGVLTVMVVLSGVGLGGVVALLVSGRLSWRHAGGIVLILGMALTSGGALALRLDAVSRHPLVVSDGAASAADGQVAKRRGKITVVMRIVDDPVAMRPASAGRVRIPVRVVEVGGRRVSDGSAELTGPSEQWSTLTPGQHVRAVVSVRAPPPHTTMVARLSATGAPRLEGRPPLHQRVAAAVRERMRSTSAKALPSPESGLLPGLVLGDVTMLDGETRDEFTAAGMSHLTAVSGSNFAIVCGAAILLCAVLGASPRMVGVLGLLVIVGFVILVRPSPSVLRAAMMGGIGLLALMRAQRAHALSALGAAIIGGLLWWPDLALAPGFALSVAATASIVLWGVPIREWLRQRRIPAGVAEILAMAIAAQLATAPIIALMSGTFSVVAVVANVLVAPVVGVISIVGTVAALVGSIGPRDGPGVLVAELLARMLTPMLRWMTGCADVFGGAGWATIEVPDGVAGALAVVVVTCTVVIAVRWMWGRTRRRPYPTAQPTAPHG